MAALTHNQRVKPDMTEKASNDVVIWREAMEKALNCVPFDLRDEVLVRLAAKREADAKGPRFKVICVSELMEPTDSDGLWNPIARATSVMVQTLVRFITNNHPPERAAGILFREHRSPGFQGTGSGFLPDYLDSLPGLTVDRDKCVQIAIAEATGKQPA
jgi:hypothetical protein